MLVHDETLLSDRQLVESVAAAAKIAVANARLQAEAQVRATELEASRRRIVRPATSSAGGSRWSSAWVPSDASSTSWGCSPGRAEVPGPTISRRSATWRASSNRRVASCASSHRACTRGTHRRRVSRLRSRFWQRAQRLPVEIQGEVGPLPEPVEAALFFVCSEALANVVKHAAASRATIELRTGRGRVVAIVVDNGAGGADPSHGSGLRGLADRVEALGGHFAVESTPGTGTRVIAELPRDR